MFMDLFRAGPLPAFAHRICGRNLTRDVFCLVYPAGGLKQSVDGDKIGSATDKSYHNNWVVVRVRFRYAK